jgi:hypothetical protein
MSMMYVLYVGGKRSRVNSPAVEIERNNDNDKDKDGEESDMWIPSYERMLMDRTYD